MQFNYVNNYASWKNSNKIDKFDTIQLIKFEHIMMAITGDKKTHILNYAIIDDLIEYPRFCFSLLIYIFFH